MKRLERRTGIAIGKKKGLEKRTGKGLWENGEHREWRYGSAKRLESRME